MKTIQWAMMAAATCVSWLIGVRAGELTPSNSPGPTMHTLEEIYQKVKHLGPAQTLSPTTTVVEAGNYAATLLEIVDPDLVASNIRAGVTLFGIKGTVLIFFVFAKAFRCLKPNHCQAII